MKTYTTRELSRFSPEINWTAIPGFRTIKETKKYAKSIGWPQYHILNIEKRFERFYVVAQENLYTKEKAADVIFYEDHITFPLPTHTKDKRDTLTIWRVVC